MKLEFESRVLIGVRRAVCPHTAADLGTLPKIFPHMILKNVLHWNLIWKYMGEFCINCNYFRS
jgi:hypothetical protein